MTVPFAGNGPALTAAFLGSFVEFVEALTIVLAVSVTRGWRVAASGAAVAVLSLSFLVLALGSAVNLAPLSVGLFQFLFGLALVLFGMRWLRKSSLRAAGALPLRDEAAVFVTEVTHLEGQAKPRSFDWMGFVTAFNGVLIEGVEVVFIVVAIGSATKNIVGASLGAGLAAAVVVMLGVVLHRPLTRVPENLLKFCAGALISSLGTFWIAEALKVPWFGGDASLLWLIAAFLTIGFFSIRATRLRSQQAH